MCDMIFHTTVVVLQQPYQDDLPSTRLEIDEWTTHSQIQDVFFFATTQIQDILTKNLKL